MPRNKRVDHGWYKLQGKLVVPVADLYEWAAWMEETHAKRHVADTTIGAIRISTVFLGLDHNYGRYFEPEKENLPILFETMIFRGGESAEMWRYETWQQAEEGHKAAVATVRAEIIAKAKEKAP